MHTKTKWPNHVLIKQRSQHCLVSMFFISEYGLEFSIIFLTFKMQAYTKQPFPPSSESGSKLVARDKRNDTLSVVFRQKQDVSTKREILVKPLGFALPKLLQRKLMYRDSCMSNLPWDSPSPENLANHWKAWKTWECNLPPLISTHRSLATYCEPIQAIEQHSLAMQAVMESPLQFMLKFVSQVVQHKAW